MFLGNRYVVFWYICYKHLLTSLGIFGMLLIMKRITITLDDSIFEQLRAASEESMRPVATEVLYRVKLGLSGGGDNAIQPQVKVSDVTASKGVEESKMFAGSGDTYLS